MESEEGGWEEWGAAEEVRNGESKFNLRLTQMDFVFTFALLWRKETNSVFHDTAQALNEFLTGRVDSTNGPTANASGIASKSSSNCNRLSTWR